MKAMSKISAGLNLVLLGSLIFVVVRQRKEAPPPTPVSPPTEPVATAAVSAPPLTAPEINPEPFHWRQIESTNDYRRYIANLRAIGCPESTVEDITWGDADRLFALQRRQQGLDGSGTGPWSRWREAQLVASLLGNLPAAAPSLKNDEAQAAAAAQTAVAAGLPSPLFLQNPDWNTLGFTPDQQAAITQVRRQFLSQINGQSQNTSDPSNPNFNSNAGNSGSQTEDGSSSSGTLAHWHTALQMADEQLREELGAQGYMAYEQQQYNAWYQPQVIANIGAGTLHIDPDAFSVR